MKKVIKFKKLHPDAIIPNYAHKGDAGLDLYSIKDEIIDGTENISLDEKIDYTYAKEKIGEMNSQSIEYLKKGVL